MSMVKGKVNGLIYPLKYYRLLVVTSPSRPQFTEVTTFFPSSFPLKVGRQIGVIRH